MWKALIVLAVAAAPVPAVAHAASCTAAETNFRAARAELRAAIDAYAACVAGSTGGDDCAAAFRKVRALQSDFRTATADLGGNCPPE